MSTNLAAAKSDPGGNTAGIAESQIAERDDRKPVDLANLFAIGLDTDRLAADLLLQTSVDPVTAAELDIDRQLHFGRGDDLPASAGGDLVGLLQQIDDPMQPG
jgi:hypothetical protein